MPGTFKIKMNWRHLIQSVVCAVNTGDAVQVQGLKLTWDFNNVSHARNATNHLLIYMVCMMTYKIGWSSCSNIRVRTPIAAYIVTLHVNPEMTHT